jgi:hypothetical protein
MDSHVDGSGCGKAQGKCHPHNVEEKVCTLVRRYQNLTTHEVQDWLDFVNVDVMDVCEQEEEE